ncbi:uncharacterized protein LOC115433426 isoform X2 [Sphaeramia orbicularis]|uniref:uncharacterized protein LOC115433426 isoform X2 n=1 Tax=Sphaeramia orbicularis TaxID=375764 RepID=UPI0011801669|nr:uncharacterized protein LOC115433426 isoform X2 [Sphaeramia orbicularis]
MESNYISHSYVWQRRIQHGIRYQKGPIPFPQSVEIGLDFNAAFERTEKLDRCLLTNGVMLEICEFAKTVNKSEMYFLFEMLDFNFDLGLDPHNRRQHFNYAARIHNRVKFLKEQMKPKTQRYQEIFILPGPVEPTELVKCYSPKWSEMDISVLTKDSSSQSSATQQADGAFMIKKPGGIELKLMTDAYPNCLTNGVTLVIPPKDTPRQKLDPNLLTIGVMVELLDFSKLLSGTQNQIIRDLVKQNFGHTFETLFFRLHISKLMERKHTCLTPESKAAFLKETFQIPKHSKRQCKKRKILDVDFEDLPITTKRRSTLRQLDCETPEFWEHSNLSYMCPVDFETNTEGLSNVEERLEETVEVKQEDEESCLSPVSLHTSGQFNRCSTKAAYQNITSMFSEDAHDNTNVKHQSISYG